MAISRTSSAALTMAVGGVAGAAIAASDNLLVRLIGFSAGCITGFCVFLVVVVLARTRLRRSPMAPTRRWRTLDWNDLNDFNDRAYTVVRNFIDDGKSW